MDIRLPAYRVLLAIMALLFSFDCIAQLPAFTLDVTPTPQTCLGNGSLAFAVTGNDPAASMDYAVYLLPNTTTPVTIVTAQTVGGLVAGNYMVVATQSLAGQSNTATDTVSIANNIVPLAYTLSSTKVRCGSDGKITVSVTSGIAASYEILSGPVTVAPQASPVFSALPAGVYQIRVHDNCGEAVVVTYTLVQANTGLSISPVVFSGGEMPDCNTITVGHNIAVTSPSFEIYFPLTCQITILPPGGGAPQVITQVINGITQNSVALTRNIPFYYGQQYTYNVKVTDACGNIYSRNGIIVNRTLIAGVEQSVEGCGDNTFVIKPEYYVGPVTINFTTVPAGFDPVAFNPDHPTFDVDTITYGNAATNPVPNGTYVFTLTDACGHSVIKEFVVDDPEVTPQVIPSVDGCATTGELTIEFPGRNIISVIITAAPATYPAPLAHDVSELIEGDSFFMDGLPLGDYTVVITDSCGGVYEEDFELAPTASPLTISQYPGCQEGFGSVRISSAGSAITTAEIIVAPETFTEEVPFGVNANIAANGRLYMNALPEGVYVFSVADDCGALTEQQVVVDGYNIALNDVDLTPNCNSFNLNLHHTSNGNNLQTFWLQRYDAIAGVWEHPISGANYAEGATPNTNTAYLLNNNSNNINIASTGQFRVIKMFYTWGNGSPANFRCIEEIYDFEFDGNPVITDAYSFPCAGGLTEVLIVAEGVPPLTYRITTKNNQPFVVENGTSNHFTGLEPATYNFQVTDFCGNLRNIQFDINALDPIEITADGFCEGEASSLSVEEFSFLTYQWWRAGAPGMILSTTGSLNFPSFNSATQAGIYFVSITSPVVGSCINQVLQYEVLPNVLPNAGNDNSLSICNNGGVIDLDSYLSAPHTTGGVWTDTDNSGALTANEFNTAGVAEGTYRFTYKVTAACDLEDEAVVTVELKDIPGTPVIGPVAAVCEGTSIQLSAASVAGASYSWTGPGNFTSSLQNPVLSNTTVNQSGNYSLAITVNGCVSSVATVAVSIVSAPVAGADSSLSFCNDGQQIDLEDHLSVPHTAGGVWTDADTTGALTGSIFNTVGIEGGTYHFTYKVTSPCGQDDEATITIELKARPIAPVIAPVASVCEGNAIQFSVTAIANATYQWTGPNNFTSTEKDPLLSNATTALNGIYSLVATVNGCTAPVATVNVTVNAMPVFTVGGTTSFCEGQSTVLNVVPGNFPLAGVAYAWYHNDILLPGVNESVVEVFETGNYRVEVTNNGCMASREVPVTQSTGMFTVQLDAGCRNTEYVITITDLDEIDGAGFVWTGPEGYYHIGEEAVITNLAAGEYFVEVTNAEGCSENASIVVDNTSCFIPRGISPNNDGYNNSFDLSNLDVKHIKIFNRYGLEVYEKDNYINEWHGQSYRGELPTGTYFYVLTLSAGKKVTGWVYLQRQVN